MPPFDAHPTANVIVVRDSYRRTPMNAHRSAFVITLILVAAPLVAACSSAAAPPNGQTKDALSDESAQDQEDGQTEEGLRWDDVKQMWPYECQNGHEWWEARLMGIPWGQSWEKTCMATEIWIQNRKGAWHNVHATSCDSAFNVWGRFEVPC
jgi:hypothetical protein